MEDLPSRTKALVDKTLFQNSVCARNRVHRAMVEGSLDRRQIERLIVQQWHYHLSVSNTLYLLARLAEDVHVRHELEDMARLNSLTERDCPSLLWLRIAEALKIKEADLLRSEPSEATVAMINVQRRSVAAPFAAAYLSLMVGVFAESASWQRPREEAFRTFYGVGDSALEYFHARLQSGPSVDSGTAVDRVSSCLSEQDLGVIASRLRATLEARSLYFDSIGSGEVLAN